MHAMADGVRNYLIKPWVYTGVTVSEGVVNHKKVIRYLHRVAYKDEKDLTGIAKNDARKQNKTEYTFALHFLVIVFIVVVLYGTFCINVVLI